MIPLSFPLERQNIAPLMTILSEILTVSGHMIKDSMNKPFYTDIKADGSIVTSIDRAVEEAIRAILYKKRPEDSILGEEYGFWEGTSGYLWTIDPIDGTHAFITGRPTFVTLIGVLYEGYPILGAIDQPLTQERWLGTPYTTKKNNRRVFTRRCDDLSKAVASATHPTMFEGKNRLPFQRLVTGLGCMIYGGDGYAYGLLASGLQDIILETSLKVYDYMPLIPIIQGAGGVITDWSGCTLDNKSTGHILAAGDPLLHQQAIKILKASPIREPSPKQ